MALGADNLKSSGSPGIVVQLDIRTTARHVGGNGNRAVNTGVGNDFRLQFMELGVQHLMLDSLLRQKL